MATRLATLSARRAAHHPEVEGRVKRRGLPEAQVQALAEQKVFTYLEHRWRHELKGRKIPKNYRKKMRKDAFFRMMVDQVLAGGGVGAPDLDVMPVVERQLDGTVTNRMEEELGGDPNGYFCRECGEEMEAPSDEPCSACVKFHQQLYGG